MAAFIVGLTGGIGSGKTTVANLFAAHGIEIIDADLLAREVVLPGSPALAEIARHFGTAIIDSKGELKRAQLRKLVFADDTQRTWLEQLLHPLIANLMQARLSECNSPYCILASPLLLETDQHRLVNRILVIDVSEQAQLRRTVQRDGSDEDTIRAIIAAQTSREARTERADDILDNDQDFGRLEEAVNRLHANYLNLAQSHRQS